MRLAQALTPTDIIGSVTPPPGVTAYDAQAGGIGLILFLSTLIRVFTVVAGLYVMAQFLLAGWQYITANGDTGVNAKVRERITMSLIGIVIIVASYTVAGMIGYLFFGDASFILNPNIQGPTAPAPVITP